MKPMKTLFTALLSAFLWNALAPTLPAFGDELAPREPHVTILLKKAATCDAVQGLLDGLRFRAECLDDSDQEYRVYSVVYLGSGPVNSAIEKLKRNKKIAAVSRHRS